MQTPLLLLQKCFVVALFNFFFLTKIFCDNFLDQFNWKIFFCLNTSPSRGVSACLDLPYFINMLGHVAFELLSLFLLNVLLFLRFIGSL